jgi:hypothetical protein
MPPLTAIRRDAEDAAAERRAGSARRTTLRKTKLAKEAVESKVLDEQRRCPKVRT